MARGFGWMPYGFLHGSYHHPWYYRPQPNQLGALPVDKYPTFGLYPFVPPSLFH